LGYFLEFSISKYRSHPLPKLCKFLAISFGTGTIETDGLSASGHPHPALSQRLRVAPSAIAASFGDPQTQKSQRAMTDPDPNPFGNCDVIVCGAGLFDKHLASRIHSVDDEIFGWLQRPRRDVSSQSGMRLACSW